MFQFISNLIIIFIRCYSRIIWKLILQHHLMHNYLNSYLSSVYTQYNTVILISLNHLSGELSLGLQLWYVSSFTRRFYCVDLYCAISRGTHSHSVLPFHTFFWSISIFYRLYIYSISRIAHLLSPVHVTYIANIPCSIPSSHVHVHRYRAPEPNILF